MTEAIGNHIDAAIKWAHACSNTFLMERASDSCCYSKAPSVHAYNDTTLCDALLGVGAHALVAVYLLILTALFTLPLLLVGGILLLINKALEQCTEEPEANKRAKAYGNGAITLGLNFPRALSLECFNIFATLGAYCS